MKNRIHVLIVASGVLLFSSPFFVQGELEEENLSLQVNFQNSSIIDQLTALQKIEEAALSFDELKMMLSPALESPDIRIVIRAVRLLYEKGDRESIAKLFALIESAPSENEKIRVLQAIIGFKDPSLLLRLREYLETSDDYGFILTIAEALLLDPSMQSIDSAVMQQLKMALEDGDTSIKTRALTLLGNRGEEALPIISVACGDEDVLVRQEAFRLVRNIGGKKALALIRPYAQSDAYEIMYEASFSLGVLGEPGYFRFITRDLNNEDVDYQKRAIRFLLTKIGSSGDEYFSDSIKRLAEYSEDEDVKREAATYLSLLNDIHFRNNYK
jgi:HEAT repeat protein